jgi:hypothetical protein
VALADPSKAELHRHRYLNGTGERCKGAAGGFIQRYYRHSCISDKTPRGVKECLAALRLPGGRPDIRGCDSRRILGALCIAWK